MYECTFRFLHENCWLVDASKKFPQVAFVDNAAYVKPDGSLMDLLLVSGQGRKAGFSNRLHENVLSLANRECCSDVKYYKEYDI